MLANEPRLKRAEQNRRRHAAEKTADGENRDIVEVLREARGAV